MRVVLLTGIWPPDVGGPATHGAELARHLLARGHEVHVVTMADGEVAERPCPVQTVSRSLPFPLRYSLVATRGAHAARRADLVYATGTYAAAAAASALARRPLVAKLVSDPAYERAQRFGLFDGSLEEFAAAGGGRLGALKRARALALAQARLIVVPSEYLAKIALGWGLDADRIVVVPNPAPSVEAVSPSPLEPNTFVFAGRLTRQKALRTAIDALAQVPGARLLLIGDGPERAELERHAHETGLNGRVSFAGARTRADVLNALAGARAAVLSSDWENFPHGALEALAVGTPVVATAVGGVPEIVRDGVNGLLVPPGDPASLACALRLLVEDDAVREHLAAGAAPSVAGLTTREVYGRLEGLLLDACGRS